MSLSDLHLRALDIKRHYKRGAYVVKALDGVSLEVRRGEFLGILGSSGSGKSTLLALLAGLDTPTSGSVEVDGVPLGGLTRRQLSAYRAHKVGMIFQSFNLISHYTALENVAAALLFNNTDPKERTRRAAEALEQLGLRDRMSHHPADLSGGEQQRVAVARAIVKKPEILFADEPTGNLDYDNTLTIASLLTEFNRNGLTVVIVTHNTEVVQQFTHRAIRLHYGKVTDGIPQPSISGSPI